MTKRIHPEYSPVPAAPDEGMSAGIGLRHVHYLDILEQKPVIGWIEVHPENFFSGGRPRRILSKVRALYPLSFHAVGLSLGSSERVSRIHLDSIKELISIYEPFHVSDHASWSMSGNAHLNDLMPLPYTEEALEALCRNIDETQDVLQRQILIENPSSYIAYKSSTMPEWEFMNEAARRTGCNILLDVNNIFVQAHNHGDDPYKYVAAIHTDHVREIHLAGHIERTFDGSDRTILIDTHSREPRREVWDLYDFSVRRHGRVPTLIEWDADTPALDVLVSEAHKAQNIINRHHPLETSLADAAE